MGRIVCALAVATATVVGGAVEAWAVNGKDLIMRSGGSASGNDWTINDTGYVGTYITLAAPGAVTIDVQAQGVASSGVAPKMNIVINDEKVGWDVPAGFTNYQHTFNLPAGTHFVRTEFANDHAKTSRQLQVRSLNVTGATVANTNTSAMALAASNTYIDNYRKGNVSVALAGATPGTSVGVKLKNHAFNWGTAVAGFNTGTHSTIMDPNPAANSNAAKYQAKIKELFNAIVPENAGKWRDNEFTRNSQWHPQLDKINAYAAANGLRIRGHNLIWDNQQPDWVNNLLNSASGNATARADLRQQISERIAYYADLTDNAYEVDLYNEMVHTPKYWNAYGAAGIAGIYNEAAAAFGPETRIATNEYNIFQDSGDFYGNWYKDSIEQLLANNGAVTAIGIQSYENNWEPGDGCWCSHYPVRKMQTLQNLSTLDMPITLTEFGVKSGTSAARTSQILDETMRLMFGSPNATGFYMWGFWQGAMWDQAPAAALFDNNWNLTPAGQTYLNLRNQWNTDLTAIVDENGEINFAGFWGDYELTIGDEIFDLSLVKGTTDYSLTIADVILGDFDFNGVVDGADLLLWQQGESPNGGTEAELLAWINNFGYGYGEDPSPEFGAIPEPTSLTLLLIGACAWRRRSACSASNFNTLG